MSRVTRTVKLFTVAWCCLPPPAHRSPVSAQGSTVYSSIFDRFSLHGVVERCGAHPSRLPETGLEIYEDKQAYSLSVTPKVSLESPVQDWGRWPERARVGQAQGQSLKCEPIIAWSWRGVFLVWYLTCIHFLHLCQRLSTLNPKYSQSNQLSVPGTSAPSCMADELCVCVFVCARF